MKGLVISMQEVLNAIVSFWELILYLISNFRLADILDIAVVAFLIYKCIGFFRQNRGGQLAKGIIIILVIAGIAAVLDMVSVNWLMERVFDSVLIAAVIIFQPEIRRALEHVGTSRLGNFGMATEFDGENTQLIRSIDAVSKAAGSMQEAKCGALIVFERTTQLGDIISTGTMVDATSSPAIITNIFFPKSPLHDGAMILKDGKVHAAGCILPLSQNHELNKALGTRHRAAIGMSENSDAVVVVVSEETGTISVAVNGELRRGFDAITLHTELTELLVETVSEKVSLFSRITSVFKSKKSNKK